jgi:hypothetical protein
LEVPPSIRRGEDTLSVGEGVPQVCLELAVVPEDLHDTACRPLVEVDVYATRVRRFLRGRVGVGRGTVDHLGQRLEREPAEVGVERDDATRAAHERAKHGEYVDRGATFLPHRLLQEVRQHLLGLVDDDGAEARHHVVGLQPLQAVKAHAEARHVGE